jgi:hypothetical protein
MEKNKEKRKDTIKYMRTVFYSMDNMNMNSMNMNRMNRINNINRMDMSLSQLDQLRDIVVRQSLPIESTHSSYSSIQASSHLSTESELANAVILSQPPHTQNGVESNVGGDSEMVGIDCNRVYSEGEAIPIPISIYHPLESTCIVNRKYIYGTEGMSPVCGCENGVRELVGGMMGMGGSVGNGIGNRSRCSSHESVVQQIIRSEDRGFDVNHENRIIQNAETGTGIDAAAGIDTRGNASPTGMTMGDNSGNGRNGVRMTSDDDIHVLSGNNEVDVGIRPDVKTHDVVIQICSCSIHCFS